MVKKLTFYLISASLFGIFFTSNAFSQNPRLSLDGSDVSHHLLLELEEDGSPNTIVFHGISSEDGSTIATDPDQMGKHEDGDIVAAADYTGDGVTDMAIVRQLANRLRWQIRVGGENVTRNFGRPGDTIIAGCDFRGNGEADLAFVRGNVFRYRDLDGEIPTGAFRIRGRHKYFTCGDINGDGHDELIALSERPRRGDTVINAWKHDGTELVRNANFGGRIKRGVIAADINQDGMANICIYRAWPGGNRFVCQVLDGDLNEVEIERIDTPNRFRVAQPAQLATGTYRDSEQNLVDGITFRARGGGGAYYRFNFSDRVAEEIDISAIDTEYPIRLARSVNVINTARSGDNGGSGGGGGVCGTVAMRSAIICHQCEANVAIPRSESDGRLVALFHNKYNGRISSVQVVRRSDCAVLATGRYAGLHNPWGPTGLRSHWRFDQPGGNYGNGLMIKMNRSDGGGAIGYDLPNGGVRTEWREP